MEQLTVAEADTLAALICSATSRMATARRPDGEYAWPHPVYTDMMTEMRQGTYDLIPLDYQIYIG